MIQRVQRGCFVRAFKKNTFAILLINAVAIIIAYYLSLLLHEWGHGTIAWLYGVKKTPFDIQYGGWFLLNADENVNYNDLINSGRGVTAALISIAGVCVSFIYVIVCFILLNCKNIQSSKAKFIVTYWFLIINMIPLVQYFTISAFSFQGDVGRFVNGLNISPWEVFIPGTIFIIAAMSRILKIEIPKSYVVIPIKTLFGQRIFLLLTLCIIFLLIYTHGYNPITDKSMNLFGKILAILSVVLVPALFVLFNPV